MSRPIIPRLLSEMGIKLTLRWELLWEHGLGMPVVQVVDRSAGDVTHHRIQGVVSVETLVNHAPHQDERRE